MDYIQEEMNRQQMVMELLTEPSAERAAETPAAAAVRKVLAAAAETVDLGRNHLSEVYAREPVAEERKRSFGTWDPVESMHGQAAARLLEAETVPSWYYRSYRQNQLHSCLCP